MLYPYEQVLLDVEIMYESTAWDLILDDEGAVEGLKVRINDGSSRNS